MCLAGSAGILPANEPLGESNCSRTRAHGGQDARAPSNYINPKRLLLYSILKTNQAAFKEARPDSLTLYANGSFDVNELRHGTRRGTAAFGD